MIIVIEGVDNSGKSTLASKIAERLGLIIIPSEGPPKYPGEMDIRLHRYDDLDNVIFDRHPVVSQTIYGTMRGHVGFNPHWEVRFYTKNPFPFFIYCDPNVRGLDGHLRNKVDTDEHLAQIEKNYASLLASYRAWAIEHANLVYRIGDSMALTCSIVETAWRQSCSTQLEISRRSTRNSDFSITGLQDTSNET